jgi:hypothetical protein
MAARKIQFEWVAATANDLRGGEAVFRRADGSWTRAVAEAEFVPGGEAGAALLGRAQADHAANRIVEPTLIAIDPATHRPLSVRERIRADGPTV